MARQLQIWHSVVKHAAKSGRTCSSITIAKISVVRQKEERVKTDHISDFWMTYLVIDS